MKKLLIISIITLISLSVAAQEKRLAILFTNDMHSSGDYARMATLIEQQRNELQLQGYPIIVLDAGDIVMGSVFHTLYTAHAFEYITLAKMGYDAYTFGNHDFDFGMQALCNMFESASEMRDIKLPVLLCSNLTSLHNPNGFKEITGVKDTLILKRHYNCVEGNKSVKIGLFGLMGEHAYSCIACSDSLVFTDRVEAAHRAVEALQSVGADYIIALSHGGTLWADGNKVPQTGKRWHKFKEQTEDGILALNVGQINAIISGHDHESLSQPIIYGKTAIASTGSKNANLGKMLFHGDSLVGYELIPVTGAINPHTAMQQWIEESYRRVEENFFKTSNLFLGDTIAYLQNSLDLNIAPNGNLLLGHLVAESYIDAVPANYDELISVVPYGIIREGLKEGYITNHDIFNVLPLGMCENGAPGYPLVLAWLTGEELWDICELNASVAGGMEDARLFFAGMSFKYNRYKLPFTRVTEVLVYGSPVDKQKLYPVVTGLYTAQLMGMLESSSFGLLSVTPKQSNGNPINDITSAVLKQRGLRSQHGDLEEVSCNATEQEYYLTEWKAFAEYVKKTELKDLTPVLCSIDDSTPVIYLKYAVALLAVAILTVLLLWSGRRLLYRQS